MTDDYTVMGQMSLFGDQGTCSGRMSLEPQVQAKSKVQTSQRSSKRQSKSLSQVFTLKCLTKDGHMLDVFTQKTEVGVLPIPFTMLNSGVYLSEDGEYLCFATSTDSQHQALCLTLNIGEQPREPMPTHLSEILQEVTDPKYLLSPRACQGILNRAEKRGKALPEILKDALEEQTKRGSDPAD